METPFICLIGSTKAHLLTFQAVEYGDNSKLDPSEMKWVHFIPVFLIKSAMVWWICWVCFWAESFTLNTWWLEWKGHCVFLPFCISIKNHYFYQRVQQTMMSSIWAMVHADQPLPSQITNAHIDLLLPKEVNLSWAKPPLKFNGGLAQLH